MPTIRVVAPLLIAIAAGGCVDFTYSLDPVFSGLRTPCEPGLLGTWTRSEGDTAHCWVVSTGSESTYTIRFIENGNLMGAFVGRSGRIKGAAFLDLMPKWTDADTLCGLSQGNTCLYNFFLSHDLHLVLRLDLADSTVVIRELDAEGMVNHLHRSRRPIDFRSHVHEEGKYLLLVAPGKAVRGFIGEIADAADVFDELLTLHRFRGASAPGQ